MRNIIIKEVDGISNKKLQWNDLIIRQAVKTKALWLAAEILKEKLEPDKSVDAIYEMLKIMGQERLIIEKPELKKYFENRKRKK